MDIPPATSRPRGMELLQDDLRLMIFLEMDFWPILVASRISKAWRATYFAHRTYIYRRFLRGIIEEENMLIAIARYAASKLTWTPSPIHGFSRLCSLEEIPGKLQEFGNKYLVPGASIPIGHKMAKDMMYFHKHVRNWSSNFWDFESPGLNKRKVSRFENSLYIFEVLRLLFPVSLEDNCEKDKEIFTALSQFFAPWKLDTIGGIESNMIELCPDWFDEEVHGYYFINYDIVSFHEAFMPIFSSLGVEGMSKVRVDGVLECQSLVDYMLQAEGRDTFALTPRESYQCPGGTFSWLVEKGTLHHIQHADIEGLLSKYPENDTGPADSWLYQKIRFNSVRPMLPRPLHNIPLHICDRKTLEIQYGESFPSRNELIDILEGARLDYRDKKNRPF